MKREGKKEEREEARVREGDRERQGEREGRQQKDSVNYSSLHISFPPLPVMATTWLAPQPTSTVSWSSIAGTSLG